MSERDPILIAKQLAEPFDPSIISWRVGSVSAEKQRGMALAYIDARDVMRRLDEAVGPENWQDEYPWSDGKRVVCRIGIKIGDDWVYKADGAGDTDYEGEKGALSDAFKRAAVKWGVGRYLYDVAAPWVAVEKRGKTWIIAENELPRLRSRLPAPRARAAQKPAQQLADPWADQPSQKPAPAPAQQRNAPGPSSPVANGTGHQAAPAEHPKRQDALDAHKRIQGALTRASEPKAVDEIIERNSMGLAIIKEVNEEAYDRLMALAAARKSEMYASA